MTITLPNLWRSCGGRALRRPTVMDEAVPYLFYRSVAFIPAMVSLSSPLTPHFDDLDTSLDLDLSRQAGCAVGCAISSAL